jgi:hypothetical protein
MKQLIIIVSLVLSLKCYGQSDSIVPIRGTVFVNWGKVSFNSTTQIVIGYYNRIIFNDMDSSVSIIGDTTLLLWSIKNMIMKKDSTERQLRVVYQYDCLPARHEYRLFLVMAKRKIRYPEPKPMSDAIKAQFQALMQYGRNTSRTYKSASQSQITQPQGQLWRWDTLEDVSFPDHPE